MCNIVIRIILRTRNAQYILMSIPNYKNDLNITNKQILCSKHVVDIDIALSCCRESYIIKHITNRLIESYKEYPVPVFLAYILIANWLLVWIECRLLLDRPIQGVGIRV